MRGYSAALGIVSLNGATTAALPACAGCQYSLLIVLAEHSIAVVERFWAADLNCRVEDLRGEQVIVTRRSGGPGVFIFARPDVLTVPTGVQVDNMLGPAFI